ncbi:MAG: MFS transporter [Pyrobaculum sp.]
MSARVNLATLLFFTANGISIVAVPPYLRDLGVADELIIGSVVSTAFFVSIVLKPLSGFLGDRLGYSKVLKAGLLFAVVAQLAYLMHNPTWVQVGRVFQGMAIATFLPISIAASVAEGVGAMASRSLAVGIGNILGPLLGSVIYDWGGASISFFVATGIHLVNFLFVRGLKDGSRVGSVREPTVLEKKVLLFMALMTIYAMTYMSLSTFIPVRLRDMGLPISYWGLFSSVGAVASLVPRAFLLRYNMVNPITAALATGATLLGLYAVTFAEGPAAFALAGVVYGLGYGAVVITHQILALAGSKRAGLASSIYTMGWDLGSITGPLVGGFLVRSVGYSALHVLPLMLLINVVVLIVYAALGRAAA